MTEQPTQSAPPASGPDVAVLKQVPYTPFPDGVPAETLPATAETKARWPARYYASFDTAAVQPTPVTGWWDVWAMSDVSAVPGADTMLALDDATWTARLPFGAGVQGGKIVSFLPPATPVPLMVQAASDMDWIHQQASLAAAMGETFTDAMKAYVKAVAAIASGTDTTSTALPARPDPVMG